MNANHLAFDIGAETLRWGVVSPGMVILEQGVVTLRSQTLEGLSNEVASLASKASHEIDSIGVSVSGSVSDDDPQGTVLGGEAPRYLDGVPLGAELSFATSLPVSVTNCGKAAALGEYAAGALRGAGLGVAILLGSHIDGGIVCDGRALCGAHGFAGSFGLLRNSPFEGEMRLSDDMDGTCGWPALKRAILETKGMLDVGDVNGHALFDWVMRGDPDALRGLHSYAKQLCMWILNLQCVLDPEVFAIGGGISAQPALAEALQTTLRAMLADLPVKGLPRPKIVICELGDDARLIGAVYEARRRAGR